MPHVAFGDIAVVRSRLSKGEQGVDETVDAMMEMAKGEYGARSAKIRALAINIVNGAGVGDKDYWGMIKAIHNWVRDEIRYVKDPVGQETLSYPEETAFNSKAGDCLVESTRLLTPAGYVALKDVKPGMTIQGRKGWTKVTKVWDKGALPVKDYHLDNGGLFTATDDHRCFLLNGGEARAGDLRIGDALLGPAAVELPDKRGDLTEDDCYFIGVFLADGWAEGLTVSISGKDGFAKEAQKHWVQTYAEGRGWKTKWNTRYIDVWIPKAHTLHAFFYSGRLAPEKAIPDSVIAELTPSKLRRLLDGMLADSYSPLTSKRTIGAEKLRKRQTRSGTCYSTTSHDLAKQARLLFRLTGVGVRDTLVVDHGGLGTHPVHRIYPRFFRPKPAKVEEIVEAGVAHCYDIATADHGIYLPDADVVVHNCDDKTILEIAVLGSVGIRAWPVVIGVRPGHYSHVYLDIEVPVGGRPGTKAGQVVHADPIMREWELGEEAPAHKITQKKTYEHLAGFSGLSGHPMSLGAYATAPSYLDERNVNSVRPAMRSPLVDTASRGEILNAPKVEEKNTTELDDMFQTVPTLALHEASWERLGPEGPITGAEASGSVRMLTSRKMEVAAPARRSFKTVYKPVSDFHKRLPGEAASGVMTSHGADIDVDDELFGIGTYIESVMGDLAGGAPAQKVAAVVGTVIANRAAVRAAGFIPGMGSLDGVRVRGLGQAQRLVAAQPRAIRAAAVRILRDLDTRAPTVIHRPFYQQMNLAAATVDLNSGLAGNTSARRDPFSAIRAAMAAAAVKSKSKKQSKKAKAKAKAKAAAKTPYAGAATAFFSKSAIAAVVAALKTNALAGIPAASQDIGLQLGDTTAAKVPYTLSVNGQAVFNGSLNKVDVGVVQQIMPAWAAAQRAKVADISTVVDSTISTLPVSTLPTTVDPNTGLPYGQQPQYGGGYTGQAPMQQDYYGNQTGSPYAAPPVDSFGPSDMGPAQSQEGQSFTKTVDSSSWEDEAAEGTAPPQSPDVVDDDDQAPAPRAARRRRATPAPAPAYEDEEDEGWTYEAETDDEEPEGGLTQMKGPNSDLSGDAAGASIFSLSTLAVAGVIAYIAFKK